MRLPLKIGQTWVDEVNDTSFRVVDREGVYVWIHWATDSIPIKIHYQFDFISNYKLDESGEVQRILDIYEDR